jgi:hypothetical protein
VHSHNITIAAANLLSTVANTKWVAECWVTVPTCNEVERKKMSQISVDKYASSSMKYYPDITIGKELSVAHNAQTCFTHCSTTSA